MTNAEECKDCWYWRSLSGGCGGLCGCHYYLDTGRRRVDGGDTCLSRKAGRGRPSKRTSSDASSGKSTYWGYKTRRG